MLCLQKKHKAYTEQDEKEGIMSGIPCMHFVDPDCYEGDNAEKFMGFSLPERLSENTEPL